MLKFLWILTIAVLSSCATAPLLVPQVQIKTSQERLDWEAKILLPSEENAERILHLREEISQKIESLAGDGSVGAYIINYQLFFRLDSQEERSISVDGVVPVNESRYLAGRNKRTTTVNNLRREALHRMRFILTKS